MYELQKQPLGSVTALIKTCAERSAALDLPELQTREQRPFPASSVLGRTGLGLTALGADRFLFRATVASAWHLKRSVSG
jgi:hypothetical protein